MGMNIKKNVGQMIPQPGKTFQQDWAANVDKLVTELKSLGC